MKKNPLEWTVFGISLAVIIATAAVLIHAHATSGVQPPVIVVTVGETRPQAGGFAVALDVANQGDHTAQAVVIEVVVAGAGSTERNEIELAFVPHGSRRRAWVVFSSDPRGAVVKARVVGYEEP